MALTRKEYTGNGSTTLYNVDFDLGYIDKDYVYVYLVDKSIEDQLSYTWRNDNQIELSTPVASGVKFYIRRVIPRDELVNDYEDGAILREGNLNDSYLQTLMILEEVQDGFITVDDEFLILAKIVISQNLDMKGFNIENLGEASSDSEATPLSQVNKLIKAASDLDGYTAELIDYIALKIFQSPTDGGLTEIQTRTIEAGEVYEVRKTSDNSLATIYSKAAGTTEIVQNGTDNKSGSDGVVEFYIADGDYYVEVGGVKASFTAGIAAKDVDFSEYENTSEEIAQLRFDHTKSSLILDKNQFSNGDTFDAGSSIVLAYQPNGSDNANVLTGSQNYRYLIGGYDNLIEATSTAEINGRACGHLATHHSQIRGQSNHSVCVGGSYNEMDDGWYSFIGGTKNKQLPRTSIGYSAYNFIAGTLNQVQGNSNAVFGSTNTLADEVNGSFAAGSGMNINATFSAAFGTSHTISGRDAFSAGNGNTVGEKSAAFGKGNNIGSALGSLVSGTTNTNTADYSRTMGRGALINGSHDHSDVQAHQMGSNRSYTMRIPLKNETVTGSGFTNFVSILGSAGVISADTNSLFSFEFMVNASTSNMNNVSAFKVEGLARKVGSGVVEILSENITEIYNTDTGQMQVKMTVGANANLQLRSSQGAVQDDVKWTASLLLLVRQV